MTMPAMRIRSSSDSVHFASGVHLTTGTCFTALPAASPFGFTYYAAPRIGRIDMTGHQLSLLKSDGSPPTFHVCKLLLPKASARKKQIK
jgi:hypothetical protein